MRTPLPTWETIYAHDRRAHRHRCPCCSRVINAGEAVLMCRRRKGTLALHLACATREHTPGNTWRDALECWGGIHNRALGFKVPQHRMEVAGGN